MNNLIKRTWQRKELVFVEDLRGMAFTNEDGAHTFSIAGKDENGADLALSGTVAGSLIRPDGTTTAMTGTIADGCANVTLSPECYGVSGRASLTIFLTSGGQKTAIYHAVMSIGKSSTSQVSPGVAADVVDLVNRIDTATASIPATYTALLGSIASDYDPSKTYKTGEHVWYGGYLYKAKQDIDTAESWTSGHWTKVVLADDFRSDITSLKSTLDNSIVKNFTFEIGGIDSSGMDTSVSHNRARTDLFDVNLDAWLTSTNGYRYVLYEYDVSGVFVKQVNAEFQTGTYTKLETGKKYRIMASKADNTTIQIADLRLIGINIIATVSPMMVVINAM